MDRYKEVRQQEFTIATPTFQTDPASGDQVPIELCDSTGNHPATLMVESCDSRAVRMISLAGKLAVNGRLGHLNGASLRCSLGHDDGSLRGHAVVTYVADQTD